MQKRGGFTEFSSLPNFSQEKSRADIFKKCSTKLSMGVQYEVSCRNTFEDFPYESFLISNKTLRHKKCWLGYQKAAGLQHDTE